MQHFFLENVHKTTQKRRFWQEEGSPKKFVPRIIERPPGANLVSGWRRCRNVHPHGHFGRFLQNGSVLQESAKICEIFSLPPIIGENLEKRFQKGYAAHKTTFCQKLQRLKDLAKIREIFHFPRN